MLPHFYTSISETSNYPASRRTDPIPLKAFYKPWYLPEKLLSSRTITILICRMKWMSLEISRIASLSTVATPRASSPFKTPKNYVQTIQVAPDLHQTRRAPMQRAVPHPQICRLLLPCQLQAQTWLLNTPALTASGHSTSSTNSSKSLSSRRTV
jgi:hypothetical protein